MPSTHVASLARRVNVLLIPLNGWDRRRHPPHVVTVFVVIVIVVAYGGIGYQIPLRQLTTSVTYVTNSVTYGVSDGHL
jgi:hypothetical protein